MAATGPDPARSGTTAVDRGGADHLPPALPRPPDPSGSGPGAGSDWASEAADAVERLVGTVRAKTVGPLEVVARGLVYGLVILIVGVAAAVLVAVGLVRGLNLALPGDVWVAHGITGGIFTLAGLFLWKKRTVKMAKV